jgi:hypothetical protein
MHDAMTLTFLSPSFALKLALPLASFPVSAGFPSPAEDHLEGSLDTFSSSRNVSKNGRIRNKLSQEVDRCLGCRRLLPPQRSQCAR